MGYHKDFISILERNKKPLAGGLGQKSDMVCGTDGCAEIFL